MGKVKFLHDQMADPHIVRLLTNCLIDSFNEFVTGYPGDVDYTDGLMAAHNFHKRIVLSLEEETGDEGMLWRDIALSTFANALESPEGKGDPQ